MAILKSQATKIAVVSSGNKKTYTTNFPLNENPISENNNWAHLDTTQTVVQAEMIGGVHVAHGTQPSSRPPNIYNDSSSYLKGFNENHSIEGTIWKSSSTPSSPNIEVEILLRWSDNNPVRSTPYGNTSSIGYEININQNGNYFILGSYKGPELARASSPPVPANGDKFKAQISTNANGSATIVVYWNGVEKIRYTDPNPIRGGNPGMGFYIDVGGVNNVFGFSSIKAEDL